MNGNQVTCFLEAADRKSFSKAADALFMTQPGISRTISSLEKELDCQLFIRKPYRPLELTEAGRIFQSAFLQCRQTFQEAKVEARRLKIKKDMNLRFGYAAGWSTSSFLPVMLDTLQKEFPYLNIDVACFSIGRLPFLLYEDQFDLILTIRNQALDPVKVDTLQLCKLPKVILYSEKLEEKHGPVESLEALKDVNLFYPEDEAPDTVQFELDELFAEYDSVPTLHSVSNQATMISMVENGNGAAIMDKWSQPIFMKQFRHLVLDDSHEIVLAYRRSCADNPVIQSLYKALYDAVSN
ncbi:MAG: LysR family transcriptional regulator [Mobilibacterium timonense]|uniref:LysR family transcriptional regulator n=1 Tax=Mobilibacterium timonense TaxID=1871012 RepID=UPI0023541C6C|nr:LysR family transcriptional regulator [Mobilibacterium timonense]MBM6990673.1 LysR family transcriptional regulator [Mobilibacterium timonense]